MGAFLTSALRVLVISNDGQLLESIAGAFSQEEAVVSRTDDMPRGVELAAKLRPHLVFADLATPGLAGMDLLQRIAELEPGIEVVLVAGSYSAGMALEAIQKGAADYLARPVSGESLRQSVESFLIESRRRRRSLGLENQLLKESQFAGMIGNSPAMLEVFRDIRCLAPHFQTVLLTGPRGSGKTLAAQALHRLSPVSSGPFITYECSAITDPAARSDAFGRVETEPTGPAQDLVTTLELAIGGTVFLHRFGEVSFFLQEKLLRELDRHKCRSDIRIIAASRHNLTFVRRSNFHTNLLRQLFPVNIELPPLAERGGDLRLLERHFARQFAEQYGKTIEGIDSRTQVLFSKYAWPGNVRELETTLESAVRTTQRQTIGLRDIPQYIRGTEHLDTRRQVVFATLREAECCHALYLVERLGGNVMQAAEVLDVGRATLYRILRKAHPDGGQAGPPAEYGRLVTDAQWAKIGPLLTQKSKPRVGGRPADNRLILEGILWILQHGGRWRELEAGLPCTTTCWRQLRLWAKEGVWPKIWHEFLSELNDEQAARWSKCLNQGSFGAFATLDVRRKTQRRTRFSR